MKVRQITAVLASNGVFSKASDTQFIIIVDNDTMVYIINPKYDDAVVHQIAEIYFGIHSIPKILLWYIITKYPGVNEISISISISAILGTIDLDLDGNIFLLNIDIFHF